MEGTITYGGKTECITCDEESNDWEIDDESLANYDYEAELGVKVGVKASGQCERRDCEPELGGKNDEGDGSGESDNSEDIGFEPNSEECDNEDDDLIFTEHINSEAWRAKKLALEQLEGSIEEQYTLLWAYANEVRRSNPDSTVLIGLHQDQTFSRVYVCFASLKMSFLNGCRR
ncbi:SHC-transforming protein 3, partial [Striga asiatica]